MRKSVLLTLLFVFVVFAAAGCQAPARRTASIPSLEPEQMVNIYYLAGKLGMTVSQEDDKIVLSDKNNTVAIHPKADQVYVNNNYLAPLGRTKKIDDMLHIRSTLEGQIRDNLKKAEIKPFVPKPIKPVQKIQPLISGTKIVIDAGHGGKDPGAISTHGFYEKTVNLDVAIQIADILKERGANVIMTRRDDVFIEIEERADMANRNKANLFISIHADSCDKSTTNGFTLYVAQNAGWASRSLADSIDTQMLRTGIKSRGTKKADFRVLKYTQCPAVLIELGYLSNYWEAKQLRNRDMQKRLANAIADGIANYITAR